MYNDNKKNGVNNYTQVAYISDLIYKEIQESSLIDNSIKSIEKFILYEIVYQALIWRTNPFYLVRNATCSNNKVYFDDDIIIPVFLPYLLSRGYDVTTNVNQTDNCILINVGKAVNNTPSHLNTVKEFTVKPDGVLDSQLIQELVEQHLCKWIKEEHPDLMRWISPTSSDEVLSIKTPCITETKDDAPSELSPPNSLTPAPVNDFERNRPQRPQLVTQSTDQSNAIADTTSQKTTPNASIDTDENTPIKPDESKQSNEHEQVSQLERRKEQLRAKTQRVRSIKDNSATLDNQSQSPLANNGQQDNMSQKKQTQYTNHNPFTKPNKIDSDNADNKTQAAPVGSFDSEKIIEEIKTITNNNDPDAAEKLDAIAKTINSFIDDPNHPLVRSTKNPDYVAVQKAWMRAHKTLTMTETLKKIKDASNKVELMQIWEEVSSKSAAYSAKQFDALKAAIEEKKSQF